MPPQLGLRDPVVSEDGGVRELSTVLISWLRWGGYPLQPEPLRKIRRLAPEEGGTQPAAQDLPIGKLIGPFKSWPIAERKTLAAEMASGGLEPFFREAMRLDPKLHAFAPAELKARLPAPPVTTAEPSGLKTPERRLDPAPQPPAEPERPSASTWVQRVWSVLQEMASRPPMPTRTAHYAALMGSVTPPRR